MSQAHEFVELVRRINSCSKHLLPPSNPLGKHTQEETYRILAFRLFAHAEVEGFIEDCADALVDKLSTANTNNCLPLKIKAHLVHHQKMVDHYPPLSISYTANTTDYKVIRGLLNGQASFISSNNGVSEKDVLKLFTPIGFSLDWFDVAWLSSMSDLARARGDVAHRSVVTSTNVQPTPLDERRRFVTPLIGLRKLADEVDRLLATL